MTTDEMIEVLQDYKSGKAIQQQVKRQYSDSDYSDSDWCDNANPSWNYTAFNYRVKPMPMEIYVNVYRGEINRFGAINVTKSDANKAVSCGGEVVKFIEVIE